MDAYKECKHAKKTWYSNATLLTNGTLNVALTDVNKSIVNGKTFDIEVPK